MIRRGARAGRSDALRPCWPRRAGAAAHGIGGLVPDVASRRAPQSRADGARGRRWPTAAARFCTPTAPTSSSGPRRARRWPTTRAMSSWWRASSPRWPPTPTTRPTSTGSSGQYRDTDGPAAYDSRFDGAVVATDPLPPNGCVEPPATGPGWLDLPDRRSAPERARDGGQRRPPAARGQRHLLPRAARRHGHVHGLDLVGLCAWAAARPATAAITPRPARACSTRSSPTTPCRDTASRATRGPTQAPADPALSTISHEHNETVTDPETYSAWVDPSGEEDGDLCITQFGPALGGQRRRRVQ